MKRSVRSFTGDRGSRQTQNRSHWRVRTHNNRPICEEVALRNRIPYSCFMTDTFGAAIAAIEDMKRDGVIDEYAVGGAMAVTFWSEPTTTYDLDVFVTIQSGGLLVSLQPIYAWAASRGFRCSQEHIEIEGLPVQMLPAPNALAEEAINTAAELDYAGQSVRVIRPEYLVAMWSEGSARSAKRMARAAALMEDVEMDRALLDELKRRYKLKLPAQ